MEQYILFCPVCCSTVDAESEEAVTGVQEFECESCGQTWTMEIDEARQRQHSNG